MIVGYRRGVETDDETVKGGTPLLKGPLKAQGESTTAWNGLWDVTNCWKECIPFCFHNVIFSGLFLVHCRIRRVFVAQERVILVGVPAWGGGVDWRNTTRFGRHVLCKRLQ